MLRSPLVSCCRTVRRVASVSPTAAPSAVQCSIVLTCSLWRHPQRRFSSFSDSDADEIWREMQALKKQEHKGHHHHRQQHELRQHLQQPTDADSELLPTDDDSLASSSSTLVHQPSSNTSLSSHAPPSFRPTGGPSVDAILRMRRTNRKVDTDDISNRFQKAMDYKRMRQQQKESGNGKAGER